MTHNPILNWQTHNLFILAAPVEQEIPTLPEHMSSPPFWWFFVALSSRFSEVFFYRPSVVCLFFFFWLFNTNGSLKFVQLKFLITSLVSFNYS